MTLKESASCKGLLMIHKKVKNNLRHKETLLENIVREQTFQEPKLVRWD